MDVGLVCDVCATFNAMGARACARCSAQLSLDAVDVSGSRGGSNGDNAGPAGAVTRPCAACGTMVPLRNKFCGTCGSVMSEETRPAIHTESASRPAQSAPKGGGAKKTLFFGAMQQARAKLVLIKGDGLDGVSFTLAGDEHVAGRLDAPLLFEEDPFLSPRHANFFYRSGDLIVRDEESINGVYIRIRGTRPIDYGDRFLIGEQVLEVQATLNNEDLQPEADGTYFYASPRHTAPFRIIQLLRGGDTGLAFRAIASTVTLGREGNDINFPDDPFISGKHAKVEYKGGQLALSDLGSKNGSFLRVNKESKLEHGDYVFMGQQLLRVEIV